MNKTPRTPAASVVARSATDTCTVEGTNPGAARSRERVPGGSPATAASPRPRTTRGRPPTRPTPDAAGFAPAFVAGLAVRAAPAAVVSTVTVPMPPAGHACAGGLHTGIAGGAVEVPTTGVTGVEVAGGVCNPGPGGGAAAACGGAHNSDAVNVATSSDASTRVCRRAQARRSGDPVSVRENDHPSQPT